MNCGLERTAAWDAVLDTEVETRKVVPVTLGHVQVKHRRHAEMREHWSVYGGLSSISHPAED